jgi:molybdate transport system substrate-binding protein
MKNSCSRRAFVIASLCVAIPCLADGASEKTITVFAASSLTNVMQDLGAEYTKATGVDLKLVFAASSVLARQIESGAPADLYLSADEAWMDELSARGSINPRSRRDVASNRLVLIARTDSGVRLKIEPGFKLLETLAGGRLAIGDPAAVPAGKYAREALANLGVWPLVEHRTVLADNVRTALSFVARGEAPLGIVYETDARIDGRVRIIDFFPPDSHAPIRYPLAMTTGAKPNAEHFARYISGPEGQAAFRKYGFALLP